MLVTKINRLQIVQIYTLIMAFYIEFYKYTHDMGLIVYRKSSLSYKNHICTSKSFIIYSLAQI